MSKTNVLKYDQATLKYALSTAKNFYILGVTALLCCLFTTKLKTLETKKPLQKSGRGFTYKTGMCLEIIVSKIIFFSFREVKTAPSYSPRFYSLFRNVAVMGYRFCSHITTTQNSYDLSNPDLGAISCCLQMCAGCFCLSGSHPI